MPSIDMPLEQMRQYKPPLYREANFEQFWDATVAEAVKQPLNAELVPYDLPMAGLQAYAVRFDGFQGGRLAGWYVRPTVAGKFPGVCFYHGYSARGTRVLEMVPYAAQGMCVLSMDCRGQNGQSQDASVAPEGHAWGWMTKGIRDPHQYYYRYVYADALRALELLARREEVDENRLAITGGSQGGGIALAASGLVPDVAAALPDVPFLCHYRRATEITDAHPYQEIARYCLTHRDKVDQVFATLAYFDGVNLATRARANALFSVGLMDEICPPSTVFAAYNHFGGPKDIRIWRYNHHEGGGAYQAVEQVRFLANLWE